MSGIPYIAYESARFFSFLLAKLSPYMKHFCQPTYLCFLAQTVPIVFSCKTLLPQEKYQKLKEKPYSRQNDRIYNIQLFCLHLNRPAYSASVLSVTSHFFILYTTLYTKETTKAPIPSIACKKSGDSCPRVEWLWSYCSRSPAARPRSPASQPA